MDLGIKDTVNDACIPIKVFHGHVASLRNKVDCIFIPRLMSLEGSITLCPKFLGLPDMVKSSVENLPPGGGEPEYERHLALPRFFLRVGKKFTSNIWLIWRAYFKALYIVEDLQRNSSCRGTTPHGQGKPGDCHGPPKGKGKDG
jgi:predicted nucleotide-binding protein (sugar kinase/HSP70/actin superfamily)